MVAESENVKPWIQGDDYKLYMDFQLCKGLVPLTPSVVWWVNCICRAGINSNSAGSCWKLLEVNWK